jgi:VWFA-related protein
MRNVFSGLALLFLAGTPRSGTAGASFAVTPPGQAAAPTPTPKPLVFAGDASLVLVDVVATDKQARPVFDLLREEFRVFEDGVLRPITSFVAFGAAAEKYERKRSAEPAEAAPPSDAAPRPAFVPASTVLFIDEGQMSITESAKLREPLLAAIRGLAERRGQVLILAPWSRIAYAGKLPEDIELAREAIGRIRGLRTPDVSSFPMSDIEAMRIDGGDTHTHARVVKRFVYLNAGLSANAAADLVRTRAIELANEERRRRHDSYEAMGIGFQWLAKQPGRHTFLLASSGFPSEPGDRNFEALVNESLRANAPIHFLDISSPNPFGRFEGVQNRYAMDASIRESPGDAMESISGSDRFASDSGGLHINALDVDRGLRRILDGTRLYYIVGYEAPPSGKSGFRKIKVEVTRKNVRLLSRRGYFAGSVPRT